MPIATRLSTPLPRSYLHDERLNSIADTLAREAFLRAKLICDNRGRLPANPGMLAGILFPSNPPRAAKMFSIIQEWSRSGLAFHYQVGSRWFVEFCDNGATSRLVGNMTEDSEYPGPPQELIDNWTKEFGCEWKPIGRSWKTGTDDVRTRSNEFEQVQTRIVEEKGVVGSRVEGNGRELVGRVGSSTNSVDLEDTRFDPDQPTNHVLLGEVFKRVSHDIRIGTKAFQRVILLKLSERESGIPKKRKDWERFMSSVMDEREARKIPYPREWLDSLSELREKIQESE